MSAGRVKNSKLWLKHPLLNFNINHKEPMTLHCDSKAAIHISNNPTYHEYTKYIEVDCYFLREKIQEGIISISHISRKWQPADILTREIFWKDCKTS